MLKVEVLEVHPPLETDHCRMLVPAATEVTGLLAKVGEEMVTLPVITDQVPIPSVGTRADRVLLVEQMV